MSKADIEVSKNLKNIAKQLSKRIDKSAGKPMMFSLVIFNDEPGSEMQYISNAEREGVQKALKSLLDGWDKGMPDIPNHDKQ